MAYNGNPDIPADIDFFVLLMIYIFRLFPCHFYEQLYYYNALYCFCKRKNKKILKTCTVNLNRQHCQKSATGKNNSFPIHCSRSKHNCVFMKFLDFRTFGSRILNRRHCQKAEECVFFDKFFVKFERGTKQKSPFFLHRGLLAVASKYSFREPEKTDFQKR